MKKWLRHSFINFSDFDSPPPNAVNIQFNRIERVISEQWRKFTERVKKFGREWCLDRFFMYQRNQNWKICGSINPILPCKSYSWFFFILISTSTFFFFGNGFFLSFWAKEFHFFKKMLFLNALRHNLASQNINARHMKNASKVILTSIRKNQSRHLEALILVKLLTVASNLTVVAIFSVGSPPKTSNNFSRELIRVISSLVEDPDSMKGQNGERTTDPPTTFFLLSRLFFRENI